MDSKIFSSLLAFVSVGHILLLAAHPVSEKSCSLDRVENSLTTALKLIKFLREHGNTEQISFEGNYTTHEQLTEEEKDTSVTSVTSVISVETNSTASCILRPASCVDIQILGNKKSGVYDIYPKWSPKEKGYKVYCDMQTEGGGWTVIQRRMEQDAQEKFNRTLVEYKNGFGNLQTEFWLGNKYLNLLTTQEHIILRLEMEDWDGIKRYAHFKGFIVQDEEQGFKMYYTEYYDSTAGADSLRPCVSVPFVAIDKDNAQKLASKFMAGFWWANVAESSMQTNLNGVFYPKGKHLNAKDGIFWQGWKGRSYSLKRIEMKLRPMYYSPEQNPERRVVPS